LINFICNKECVDFKGGGGGFGIMDNFKGLRGVRRDEAVEICVTFFTYRGDKLMIVILES
jgi:hypothetical protein